MKINYSFFIPALFILHAESAGAQNINLTLASHLSYGPEALSNIWGWKDTADGKEYALVGAADGLSIVDVTTPSSPVEIVKIAPQDTNSKNCIWREVKTWGNYAYVTTECGKTGLQIIDLTNLPSPALTTVNWKPIVGTDTLKTIHALHIDNGKVYLYGSNLGGGALVADVSTAPMAPVYLGSYNAGGYIHDGYVQGDTMYAGHIWTGQVEVVNMANPAAGVALASFQTPNAFTHNTWLSADNKTCFTTDEVNGSFVAAFDISDLSNISELDRIQSNPGDSSIAHNTYIINKGGVDYAVTSWYKDGITVVDASRPGNLVQTGNYDTSPLSGKGYGGCWGVYPYLPSGIVLVSDIDSGLYVLAPSYVRGCYLEGVVTDCNTGIPIAGALVDIQNPGSGTGSSSDLTDGSGKYAVGVLTPGTYSVVVSKAGYNSQTVTASVSTGNVTSLTVQLCVLGVEEYPFAAQTEVLPNPFLSQAVIRIKDLSLPSVESLTLSLYNACGEKVRTLLPESGISGFRIDRENMPAGLYFYRISGGDTILAAGKIAAE